jgi:hypothetical protein
MPSRVSSEEDEVTPDQLSAIRARLDAATPGPWDMWFGDPTWISVQIDGKTVAECRTHLNHQFSDGQNVWNARLITHAPTDLRALLDEVEWLTTELHASQAKVAELYADPLPAAAWVREVQQAAFRRGAEAMRAKAANAAQSQAMTTAGTKEMFAWCHSAQTLCDAIRAMPAPEDKS